MHMGWLFGGEVSVNQLSEIKPSTQAPNSFHPVLVGNSSLLYKTTVSKIGAKKHEQKELFVAWMGEVFVPP